MSTATARVPSADHHNISGDRSLVLLTSARSFLRSHSTWQDDPGRPLPDRKYFNAVEKAISAFAEGDIPHLCRNLAGAVASLAEQADLYEARDENASSQPHDDFWAAVQKIRKQVDLLAAPPPLPALESIKDLAALPGMSQTQIAMMYGFTDRSGNPMPWLVAKELETPGSIIGPSAKGRGLIDGRDWEDPRETERKKKRGIAERQLEEAERLSRAAAEAEPDDDEDFDDDEDSDPTDVEDKAGGNPVAAARHKSRKPFTPCKETPKELYEQGVGFEQAALMLGKPLDAVKAKWDAQDKKKAEAVAAKKEAAKGNAPPVSPTPTASPPLADEL